MQVLLQIFAGIAQLVEQRIRNAQVVGSSPIPSSKNLTIYPKTDVRGNTEFRLKQSFVACLSLFLCIPCYCVNYNYIPYK